LHLKPSALLTHFTFHRKAFTIESKMHVSHLVGIMAWSIRIFVGFSLRQEYPASGKAPYGEDFAELVQVGMQDGDSTDEKRGSEVIASMPLSITGRGCSFEVQAGVPSNFCISSNDNAGSYNDNEWCAIEFFEDIVLTFDAFDTEQHFDVIIVDGVHYSGPKMPPPLIHPSHIVWGTDYSDHKKGWRACRSSQSWFIQGEGCSFDDQQQCVSSLGYHPSGPVDGYGNGQWCTVHIVVDLTLRVDTFWTESGFDILTVDGDAVSGRNAPSHFIKPTRIDWVADGSWPGMGWNLCIELQDAND